MGQDSKTISNERHEVEHVAKMFGVEPSMIYQLKEEFGSSRELIYKKLNELGYTYGPADEEDYTDDGGDEDSTDDDE